MDLHKIDWENIPWEPVREGITRKSFSGNGTFELWITFRSRSSAFAPLSTKAGNVAMYGRSR